MQLGALPPSAAALLHDHPKAAHDLLRAGHLEPFLGAEGRGDLAQARASPARRPIPAPRPRRLSRPASGQASRGQAQGRAARGRPRRRPGRRGSPVRPDSQERRQASPARRHRLRRQPSPFVSLLGEETAAVRKVFQFLDRTTLTVRVVGRSLHAFRQPQQAEIQIRSNGGEDAVVVRLRVSAQPFVEGILAGAISPRQLAEKAREAPKEAAALIESGAVARWYQANGWTYPVQGPTALGVAAVQQFFEALGLVKPPVVELSQDAIVLRGAPGQKVEHVLTALTQENRAVVAHAVSDQPWLTIGKTLFRGKSAFLPLTIASVPGRSGEMRTASLTVTANGLQRFVVPVTLTVAESRPADPIASAPRTQTAPQLARKPGATPVVPRPSTAPVPEMTPPSAAPRRGPWLLLFGMLPAGQASPAGAAMLNHFLMPPPPAPVAPVLALDSDAAHRDSLSRRPSATTIWRKSARRRHARQCSFSLVTLQNGKAIGTEPGPRCAGSPSIRGAGPTTRVSVSTAPTNASSAVPAASGRNEPNTPGRRPTAITRGRARPGCATTRRSRSPSSWSLSAAARASFSIRAGSATGSRDTTQRTSPGRPQAPCSTPSSAATLRPVHDPRRPTKHGEHAWTCRPAARDKKVPGFLEAPEARPTSLGPAASRISGSHVTDGSESADPA